MSHELIILDNTQGKFKSAARALNYGGRKAKGKYIMFVHQDVNLCSETCLEEVEKTLDTIKNLGIAGVAGKKDFGGIMTIIKDGEPPKQITGSIPIKTPQKVQTLDECLVIVPKIIFNMLRFDEKTCDDWHLYAVDYCLSVKRLGFDAYVLPLFIYHRSPGYSMSESYFLTLKKLIEKHKGHYSWIYTTMGNWSTFYPLNIQRSYYFARRGIGGLLKKFRR